MLSYEEALALVRAQPVSSRQESLPLDLACGRITAADVCLTRDQPGFDRATMDGYAIAPMAGQDVYAVIGSLHAGQAATASPQPGQALRIMTGAPCPPGCAVVPHESTDRGVDQVRIVDLHRFPPGSNIARRGEDGRSGDRVIAAGTRLTPPILATAAMAGATAVVVHAMLDVGVCTTGDELDAPGEAGIADSNGPMLAALLKGIPVRLQRRQAADRADELAANLQELSCSSEVLVTTGGVSAGDKDLVPRSLFSLGYRPLFHGVAMQPGKPVLVARHPDGRWAVGLPGNPVSVLATAHLILLPVLSRYWHDWTPRWLSLPLAQPFQHRKDRRLFLPARIGDLGLEPMRWNGSGDLLAAAAADGLIDCTPGGSWAAGERLRFLPYLGAALGERGLLPESRRQR